MRFLLTIYFLATAAFGYAQPSGRTICITIDDLPVVSRDKSIERYRFITDNILKALDTYRVPGIGFVNESKLVVDGVSSKDQEDLLRRWVLHKQELGNHTYTHMDYNTATPEVFEEEIAKGEMFTNSLFKGKSDRVLYFRHPYLHTGNTEEKKAALQQILKKRHYVEAPVTTDNIDWTFTQAYDIALERKDSAMVKRIASDYVQFTLDKLTHYENVSNALFGRNISHVLLIHANMVNAMNLKEVLKRFQERGYRFVSLAEALKDPAYMSKDGFVGTAGISWLDRWALTQNKAKDVLKGEPRIPEYVEKYAAN